MESQMGIINLLKKIPVDFGQGNLRKTTKGKLIAYSFVSKAKKNMSALDVGCREGNQTKLLESKNYKVTSIDIEKVYSRAKIVDLNKKIPFKNNSFDLIWCSEVIEHLVDPKFSLSEMKRVLKPKGKIIITTPNSYFWFYRLFSLFGLPPKKLQRDDHLHFFNIKDMKNLFPASTIYGFFPYMIFKFRITNLVGLLSPTFVVETSKDSKK